MRIVITKDTRKLLTDVKESVSLPRIHRNKVMNNMQTIPLSSPRSNTVNEIKVIQLRKRKLNLPAQMEDLYTSPTITTTNEIVELPMIINNIATSLTEATLPSMQNDINSSYALQDILSMKTPRKYHHKNINMNKSIKTENSTLISYINHTNPNDNFLNKITNLNDDKLYKLNKIAQKYYHNEELGLLMRNVIRKKIDGSIIKDSTDYKHNLIGMKRDLNSYENVYKRLKIKQDHYLEMKNIYIHYHKKK